MHVGLLGYTSSTSFHRDAKGQPYWTGRSNLRTIFQFLSRISSHYLQPPQNAICTVIANSRKPFFLGGAARVCESVEVASVEMASTTAEHASAVSAPAEKHTSVSTALFSANIAKVSREPMCASGRPGDSMWGDGLDEVGAGVVGDSVGKVGAGAVGGRDEEGEGGEGGAGAVGEGGEVGAGAVGARGEVGDGSVCFSEMPSSVTRATG